MAEEKEEEEEVGGGEVGRRWGEGRMLLLWKFMSLYETKTKTEHITAVKYLLGENSETLESRNPISHHQWTRKLAVKQPPPPPRT